MGRRLDERRVAPLVGEVDARAVLDQHPDARVAAAAGSHVQRRRLDAVGRRPARGSRRRRRLRRWWRHRVVVARWPPRSTTSGSSSTSSRQRDMSCSRARACTPLFHAIVDGEHAAPARPAGARAAAPSPHVVMVAALELGLLLDAEVVRRRSVRPPPGRASRGRAEQRRDEQRDARRAQAAVDRRRAAAMDRARCWLAARWSGAAVGRCSTRYHGQRRRSPPSPRRGAAQAAATATTSAASSRMDMGLKSHAATAPNHRLPRRLDHAQGNTSPSSETSPRATPPSSTAAMTAQHRGRRRSAAGRASWRWRTACAPSTWACGARPCSRKRRPPARARRRRTSTSCTATTKFTPAATADAVLIMLGTNDARVPTADVDAHFVEDGARRDRPRGRGAAAQLEPLHLGARAAGDAQGGVRPPRRRRGGARGARAAGGAAHADRRHRRPRAARARLARQRAASTGRRRRATACTRRRSGCGGSPTRCGSGCGRTCGRSGGGSPSAADASESS